MESSLTDQAVDILEACERYWVKTHVPRRAIEEMTTELSSHLAEAETDGRSVESVVGDDLSAFAEAWAAERRPRHRTNVPTWDEVHNGPETDAHRIFTPVNLTVFGVTVVVAWAIAVFADGGEPNVDNELWRWIWVGLAGVMGFGEILTAGFFLLPFAVGAAAAAILAWLGVSVAVQWAVFLVVSVASLFYLRRFVPTDEDIQPIGANRMLHQRGLVTEPIDRLQATGKVRVEREEWRATTHGEPIAVGTEVVVQGITGTRLIVEPVESKEGQA